MQGQAWNVWKHYPKYGTLINDYSYTSHFHENLERTQVLLSCLHAMSREIAQTSDI